MGSSSGRIGVWRFHNNNKNDLRLRRKTLHQKQNYFAAHTHAHTHALFSARLGCDVRSHSTRKCCAPSNFVVLQSNNSSACSHMRGRRLSCSTALSVSVLCLFQLVSAAVSQQSFTRVAAQSKNRHKPTDRNTHRAAHRKYCLHFVADALPMKDENCV